MFITLVFALNQIQPDTGDSGSGSQLEPFRPLTSGTNTANNIGNVLDQICGDVYNLLPPVAMLLVIAGAVTYAAGQFAGAEMRARATGWATAMLVGALFAFLIVLLLGGFLKTLMTTAGISTTFTCGGAFP